MKALVNLIAILGQFVVVIVASSKYGAMGGALVVAAIMLNAVQATCVYGDDENDDNDDKDD